MNVKICSKLFRFIAQLRQTAYFSACYFAVASFSIKKIWKSSTIFQHNHLKKARNSRVSSFRSSFNAFVSLHNFSQHSLAPNYCVVGLIWNVRTTMYDIPLESWTLGSSDLFKKLHYPYSLSQFKKDTWVSVRDLSADPKTVCCLGL